MVKRTRSSRRARSAVIMGGALPTVVILAQGCRSATEVTLDIRTNVACSDMQGVEIVVAGDFHAAEDRAALRTAGTTRFPTATTDACDGSTSPQRIGTLVITPSGSDGSVVVIGAFGKAKTSDCEAPPNFAPECIVARRRFAFVDHTPITLPVLLDPSCAGVPCDEDSTCVGKKCVDSQVDCSSGTCTEPGAAGGGGVVLVDGALPRSDAPPANGDDGASNDGALASDGLGADSSKPDSDVDSGPPAIGSCPTTGSCLGGTLCGPPINTCCYQAGESCKSANKCPSMDGCCRDANDCTPGSICCASTTVPSATTHVTCRTMVDCLSGGGAAVCFAQSGANSCGPSFNCATGDAYSTVPYPDYFKCS